GASAWGRGAGRCPQPRWSAPSPSAWPPGSAPRRCRRPWSPTCDATPGPKAARSRSEERRVGEEGGGRGGGGQREAEWGGWAVRRCCVSSRRRHTRLVSDWSPDVCSSDLRGFRLGTRRGEVSAAQVVCAVPVGLAARLGPPEVSQALEPYLRRDAGAQGGAV